MASDDPRFDEVPRLRSTILRRVAEAVRCLAGNRRPMIPCTGPATLAKELECTTTAFERHVLRSRSAAGRARLERDSLARILELLDRAIALARARAESERLESAATALELTRTHIGLEFGESNARLHELLQLCGFFETGAANRTAAISLSDGCRSGTLHPDVRRLPRKTAGERGRGPLHPRDSG